MEKRAAQNRILAPEEKREGKCRVPGARYEEWVGTCPHRLWEKSGEQLPVAPIDRRGAEAMSV